MNIVYRIIGFLIIILVVFGLGSQVLAISASQSHLEVDCGETDAWNILVLGSDYGDLRGQKGSDLTRVLHVDFTKKLANTVAFPRDLWVDTMGLGLLNPDVDSARLGMVYYEGRMRSLQLAEIDAMMDGTRATSKMLSKNFSLKTDHYITIDLNHLAEMIDSIGGLPINIPTSTTDPWIGMVIEAGQQTLNGEQIVAYARAIPDSDFERIKRNNLIVEAMRQKLVDPTVMSSLPDLYAKFGKVIATDLSLEQINHLACLLKDLPTSAVTQESILPEWTTPGPQGSLLWNKDKVTTLLTETGLIP